jgi:hypothetical protein
MRSPSRELNRTIREALRNITGRTLAAEKFEISPQTQSSGKPAWSTSADAWFN